MFDCPDVGVTVLSYSRNCYVRLPRRLGDPYCIILGIVMFDCPDVGVTVLCYSRNCYVRLPDVGVTRTVLF